MLAKEFEFIVYSKGYIPHMYPSIQNNPHSTEKDDWFTIVCEWIDGSKDKYIYISRSMRDSDLKLLKELCEK